MFKKDVELDARLIVSVEGVRDAGTDRPFYFFNPRNVRRLGFATVGEARARMSWFNGQPKVYQTRVSSRADQLVRLPGK